MAGGGVAVIGTKADDYPEEEGGLEAEYLGLDGMLPDVEGGAEYRGGDDNGDVGTGKIMGGDEQQDGGGGGKGGVRQVGGTSRFKEYEDVAREQRIGGRMGDAPT